MKKEIYFRTSADSVDQIRDMIRMAKELDIKVLVDAIEQEFVGKKPELNAKAAQIAYDNTSVGEL